jgi:hypothetical protein
VAPEATFERGLAVVTFRTFEFRTIVTAAFSALGSGRYVRRHPRLDRRVDVGRCTIVGHGPVPYQVDGDFLGETDRLVLEHQPDALDLFLP